MLIAISQKISEVKSNQSIPNFFLGMLIVNLSGFPLWIFMLFGSQCWGKGHNSTFTRENNPKIYE